MMGLSKEHKSAGVWLKLTTVTEMFEDCYNVTVSIWNSADNACIGEVRIFYCEKGLIWVVGHD
jgi:hypothetical protein